MNDRKIEFRTWDVENQTWTFVTLGDLVCGACLNSGDKPLSGAPQIWEQFTGLLDRNGRKVYEGDIVQTPDDWDEYGIAAGQRYEVYFAYGGFRCKPRGFAKRRGEKGYWIEDSEDFEVVGNIHENPELLQKYKELD